MFKIFPNSSNGLIIIQTLSPKSKATRLAWDLLYKRLLIPPVMYYLFIFIWIILVQHKRTFWIRIKLISVISHQGLGLVITGTVPVFNLTADPGSSQVIITLQYKIWSYKPANIVINLHTYSLIKPGLLRLHWLFVLMTINIIIFLLEPCFCCPTSLTGY